MRACFGVVLVVVAVVASLRAQSADFDLLIRGGRIVDGSGNPSFVADLAIHDGRIVALGRVEGTSARVIEANGLAVAPGFIDIHNHSDLTLLEDADAQSMVRQGVTSMVFGEGGSAAPSERWPRFSTYFDELRRHGISTNVGSYVGSGQVWTEVRGPRAGPPDARELDEMRRIVREAMQDGALGLASSLSGPPGVWIDTDTLVALCQVVAEHGGIYSTHMRTEGSGVFKAVEEAIEIGRRAKLPVDVIHLKIAERSMWGRMPDLVALIAGARGRGQDVQANVYPYRAGQNDLASIIPPWAHEGGATALVRRLQDPALRQRLESEILGQAPLGDWYNHYTATGGWDGMLLVRLANPRYRQFVGKRMNQVIADVGKPPLDVLFELLIENGGSVSTVFFHHSEDDMRHALAQPFVSIGSDGTAVSNEGPLASGHPHPRYYGTFPRVLGRYVRELRVLSLEEAVRKMTSANAAKVRVFDRGLLRPGLAADVTIFDPGRVIDQSTFERPHQYATGVEYVIVNGTVILDRGQHTHARPGRILHGPGRRERETRSTDTSTRARDPHPIVEPGSSVTPATTVAFTEGPTPAPDGSVLFSDTANDRIMRFWPGPARSGARLAVFRAASGRANGLIFDADGRLIACEGGRRRVTRTEPDGSTMVLAERYDGKRFNTPNDLDLDRRGRIYFTDPRYGDRSDMEMSSESVYRIDPDGTVHRIIEDVQRPNGIAVSPDQRSLYVVDNHNGPGGARKLYAYDLAADGSAGARRLLHDFGRGRGGDGMCLDIRGNLYVAAGLGTHNRPAEDASVPPGIHVFAPSGARLGFIPVPEDPVTNCTFGDEDGRTLYITAGKTLFRIRTTAEGYRPYGRAR